MKGACACLCRTSPFSGGRTNYLLEKRLHLVHVCCYTYAFHLICSFSFGLLIAYCLCICRLLWAQQVQVRCLNRCMMLLFVLSGTNFLDRQGKENCSQALCSTFFSLPVLSATIYHLYMHWGVFLFRLYARISLLHSSTPSPAPHFLLRVLASPANRFGQRHSGSR